MQSIGRQKNKILGMLFCAILILSIYVGVVYALNGLLRHDFIDMVSLSSQALLKESYQFAVGDTMLVSAKVNSGNLFHLEIHDNSDRLAYADDGTVNSSEIRIPVAIQSDSFHASQIYNLTLIISLVNQPLAGMSSVDSFTGPFQIVRSYTNLNLTTTYDENHHNLRATTSLKTSDGIPVENVTINFYMQPNMDFTKSDRGWILLGATQTDANGSATYSAVLDMMGGHHGIEAKFVGDENFGSSATTCLFDVDYRATQLRIVKVEETTSLISVKLQLTYPSGFPLGGKVLSFEALNITNRSLYAITDDRGYAVLNFSSSFREYFDARITVIGDDYVSKYQIFTRLARNGSEFAVASKWNESGSGSLVFGGEIEKYNSDLHGQLVQSLDSVPHDVVVSPTPASGYVDLPEFLAASLETTDDLGTLNFTFYLNGTYTGCDSQDFQRVPGGSFEGYLAHYDWFPQAQGNYHVEVKVYNSSGIEMEYGDAYVSIDQGHCNLIVYYPEAFSGGSLNLILAFSKARSQQNVTSEYFQTIDFAPSFIWQNESYAVDQPTNSPIIRVIVNGTNVANLTAEDGTGLCGYLLSLSNYTLPCSLNVTAVIDNNERFQGIKIERLFSLSRISILDDPSVTPDASTFYMNYTMTVLNVTSAISANASTTYVNAGNIVDTQTAAFNSSAYNVTTWLASGYLESRQGANSTGLITIPTGCNYTLFRVVQACYSNSTIINTAADINKDGVVNMRDTSIAILLQNKRIGDAGYDWTVDANADGVINMRETSLVIQEFNRRAWYYNKSIFDYRLVVVTCSFGSINLDSRGFAWIPSGATWLNVSCRADVEFFNQTNVTSGVTDNGGHSRLTWNPPVQGFCVVEAWLTSPMNLTLATNCGTTSMNASLRTADYYYVFNRTIDISVDWDDQMQTTTIAACADTYVIENDSENYGSSSTIYVDKRPSLPERRAFIRFDLSSIVPPNVCIVSARLNVYASQSGSGVNGTFTVYMVNGQWSEQTLSWTNMPGLSATASSVGLISYLPSRWSSFDVTEAVRFWNNGSANYGFAILADPGFSLRRNLCSREYSSGLCPPSLQVCYLNGSRNVVVSAYDDARQAPTQASVNFSVNGTVLGSGSTNESGLWEYGVWSPSTGGTWVLGAASSATLETKASNTSNIYSLGLPTSIVSLDDGSQRLPKGTVVSNFTLSSAGIFNVSGVAVNFRVNGTYWNGTLFTCTGSNTTLDNGAVRFDWNAAEIGSFSVCASFGGNSNYACCEGYALVSVTALSLSVLFSVAPVDITPGQTVILNATTMDPLTNARFISYDVWVKFFSFCSNGSVSSLGSYLSNNGTALCPTYYPNDAKAYAFNATILNCTIQGVNLNVSNVAGSAVQLSVGYGTTLTLNVSRTSSPSRYLIDGWLKNGTLGLGNKLVSLKINDTTIDSILTNNYGNWQGYFSFFNEFTAISNASTTYRVSVGFDGTDFASASGTSTLFSGSSYSMCTTIQYNYRPCGNSTVFSVDPQSTIATISTKTPQEMQSEAEQEGTLRIRDDFSWSFPFYRRHFISLFEGVEQYDQGISPLPFVDPTLGCSSIFLQTLKSLWSMVVWPIATAVAGAEFYGLITSNAGIEAFAIAIVVSFGMKAGTTYVNWNSINGLAGVLVGTIFSMVFGLLKWSFQLIADFFRLILGVINIAQFGFGNLYRLISFGIGSLFGAVAMERLHELGAIA